MAPETYGLPIWVAAAARAAAPAVGRGGLVAERDPLAGVAAGALLLLLHLGLLGLGQRVEEPLGVGQLGLVLLLVLTERLADVGEVAELVLGFLALLGEGALLGLDLLQRLRLLDRQLVERGGLVEEAVRVRGEEEGHGGVDAAGAVLRGGDRTEFGAQRVQLGLAAGDLVLERVDFLLQVVLLLLGAVVLLGGGLGLVVELVDLRLDLALAGLGVGVGGLGGQGHGRGGSRGEHGHAGAARLLGTTVGRHGGELLLPLSRLPGLWGKESPAPCT